MTGFPSPARLRFLLRNPRQLWAAASGRSGPGLLAQRARLAQLRRDWRSALKLWRACAEGAPDNPDAVIGYIGALISAGGIEEALERTSAFVQQHPKNGNGQILLARIAELRNDFPAAIDHWRAALALKPGSLQPTLRLGSALLKEERFDEALRCAEQLDTNRSTRTHAAVLRAQIAQQQHGYRDALPLWQAGLAQFGRDASFLRAYGSALLSADAFEALGDVVTRLRKYDLRASFSLEGAALAKRALCADHAPFWKAACARLPDSVDLTRKLLHAALSARDAATANAAFLRLLEQDRLAVRDADMVIGLVGLDLQSGNPSAAREKIRSYLKGMRGLPGYRAAALRLHRAILQCFPRQKESARRISANTPLFIRMVSAARIGRAAAQTLEQIAEFEDAVCRTGATCLLDSDIAPEPCRAFIGLVHERLRTATPFSLIRLGDGEANAFQQTSSFAAQADRDSSEREKVWWGRDLEQAERCGLAARIRSATFDSDAIGFPTRERFLRDVRLDSGAALTASRSGRGLLTIMETLRQQSQDGGLAGKVFTSAHLPQDLQRWNLYPELFGTVDEAVLVSCHPSLPQILQERFGIRTAKHVLVPPGDSMREIERRALSGEDVPPHSLTRAMEELGEWPSGRLVLVGAGYAGKVIVAEAKTRGGMALDLGSIFDRWMGVNTRSYQDLA